MSMHVLNGQPSVKLKISLQDAPYCPLGQYLFATSYRKQVTGVGKVFPTFWNLDKS